MNSIIKYSRDFVIKELNFNIEKQLYVFKLQFLESKCKLLGCVQHNMVYSRDWACYRDHFACGNKEKNIYKNSEKLESAWNNN